MRFGETRGGDDRFSAHDVVLNEGEHGKVAHDAISPLPLLRILALTDGEPCFRTRTWRRTGGVATIRQYLQAHLIDQLHLAISPVVLGQGEHLLGGLDLRALGYTCTKHTPGSRAAAHVFLQKQKV